MAGPMNLVIGRMVNRTNSSSYELAHATKSSNNATLALIANLVFAESKSVRTSTIILAAFNVLASFTAACSILYDCYWASKRCNPKFKASKFCISSMHPAETFPFVLSIGIVAQGLVFAGVQGTGLESLFVKGCAITGQFMWPALFIVPYLQAVFGVECAIRSLRRIPFRARGKYDVTICCVTVVVMLIGTWIPSHISPEPDVCFGSLVWYVSKFGLWGLILLSISAGLMLLSAVTIFIRLSTGNVIDEHQRIGASRMVYHLVLGIVSLGFVIPYFVSQIIGDGDIKVAMMATVVLNLSGLMSGLLHLFLRSNTATTSFGPNLGRSWDRRTQEIKIFGPNELAFRMHLNDPVSGPGSPAEVEGRSESRTNLVDSEKGRAYSMESLRSPPPALSPARYNPLSSNAVGEIRPLPSITNEPVRSPKRGHARKQSYSLFPNGLNPDETTSPTKPIAHMRQQEPTSVYDISELQPPPMLFGGGGRGHRRDSSMASSATVQIGLRISHSLSPAQEDIMTLPPLAPTTYNANAKRPVSPLRSPLRLQTQTLTPQLAASTSPKQLSPQNNQVHSLTKALPLPSTSMNKTLPPTPKAPGFSPPFQRLAGSTTQLSPAVYSPEKKIPKPLGTPQSATLPKQSPFNDSLMLPQRSNSDLQPTTGASKGEWI